MPIYMIISLSMLTATTITLVVVLLQQSRYSHIRRLNAVRNLNCDQMKKTGHFWAE